MTSATVAILGFDRNRALAGTYPERHFFNSRGTERLVKKPLKIDGSQGEGGGQILRSSLSLSLVTGRPVRLENVRSGRPKPGLMRQHLTAVQAAKAIGDARVEGDRLGSQSLTFTPKTIKGGRHRFSVGTAGSSTLVLQTILPALMISDHSSEITIEGGTHNQWAPPFDFLLQSYLPIVNRIGPQIRCELERYGFYPAGGGQINVHISPATELQGIQLIERGECLGRKVTALVAKLPRSIAQREIATCQKQLNWPRRCFHVDEVHDSSGPGNIVRIEVHFEHVRELFTGFGRRGATAEQVAEEAADEARNYLASNAPVGKHLADQLVLPLGIAAWKYNTRSRFRTLPLSRHSTTHLEILRRFLKIPIDTVREDSGVLVTIG